MGVCVEGSGVKNNKKKQKYKEALKHQAVHSPKKAQKTLAHSSNLGQYDCFTQRNPLLLCSHTHTY